MFPSNSLPSGSGASVATRASAVTGASVATRASAVTGASAATGDVDIGAAAPAAAKTVNSSIPPIKLIPDFKNKNFQFFVFLSIIGKNRKFCSF
jgi:hypothetical protein